MERNGGELWPDFETMRDALSRPLPGSGAHVLMSPRPRPGWKPGRLPGDSRPGAGLVLLYPRDGATHIVLTVRARHLPSHRGQVSFPGGAVEPGESVREAALREAREEVGVDPGIVRVAGEATPLHIPASGYVLHPVVGFAASAPAFRAAPGEVERILEVPFREVADPERMKVEPRVLRGLPCDVPFFDLAGEKVWGATAMVLAELLQALGCSPDPWGKREAP